MRAPPADFVGGAKWAREQDSAKASVDTMFRSWVTTELGEGGKGHLLFASLRAGMAGMNFWAQRTKANSSDVFLKF